MAVVRELVCARENYRADVSQNVLEIVRFMVEHNIGAIGVVDNGELVGIFSERDLMRGVVAAGKDPQKTRVVDVMTRNPLAVGPEHTLEACMELLKKHGFRHLPVCEGKKLLGVISMRDLMEYAVVEKDVEVQMMRAYISSAS